jgi:hypothetical protein
MHLVLSTGTPYNAQYSDGGQVLYKVDSSGLGILGRTIQISRIHVPFELRRTFGDQIQRTFLARIDYKVYRSSRIDYRGIDQSTNDLFKKRSFGFYGRSVITDSPVGMIN